MSPCEIPMAAASQERNLPAGQYAKPVEVDDTEYMPGVGIRDWAEEFNQECGGES